MNSSNAYQQMPVTATFQSSDHIYSVDVDMTPWLELARPTDIYSLVCGNRGCSIVPYFVAKNQLIEEAFIYVLKTPGINGWTHYQQEELMEWLRVHKRGIWAYLMCGKNAISVYNCGRSNLESWSWLEHNSQTGGKDFPTKEDAALNAVETLGLT